jgi:hypothetical protein
MEWVTDIPTSRSWKQEESFMIKEFQTLMIGTILKMERGGKLYKIADIKTTFVIGANPKGRMVSSYTVTAEGEISRNVSEIEMIEMLDRGHFTIP